MGLGVNWVVRFVKSVRVHFVWGSLINMGRIVSPVRRGGDKTVNHNLVRDNLYIHTRRAHTAPRLEACGVSRLLGLDDRAEGQVRQLMFYYVGRRIYTQESVQRARAELHWTLV